MCPHRILLILLTSSVAALPAHAEDDRLADVASYVTAGVNLGSDVVQAVRADRRRCALGQLGLRWGLGNGAVLLTKHVVRSPRPDGSDAHGFPSGHTMNAALGQRGWRWQLGVGLTVGTAGLRMAADKHTWWQTAAGAGYGVLADWAGRRFVPCGS